MDEIAMAQTRTKRKNVIIASIIIAVLAVASISALILRDQSNQSTASPSPSPTPPPAQTPTSPSTPMSTPTPTPTPSSSPAPTRIILGSLRQTEIIQGNNSQIQIDVTSIGRAENIKLSSNMNSSSINCTFEPSIGMTNFTSTLTMEVADSTPTGNYSVTVVASGDGQEVNASGVLSVLSANVTVSGEASSASLCMPFLSSLIGIQFTDIQTGTNTSFSFNFVPPPTINPFGNYSVVLMNEHTYNVTINYYCGPSPGNMYQAGDYVGSFTVHAPAGKTSISKDWG